MCMSLFFRKRYGKNQRERQGSGNAEGNFILYRPMIYAKQKMAGAAVLFCFLLLLGCDTGQEIIKTDCAINESQCLKTAASDGTAVTFDIQPKPVKTMTGLVFSVDLKKADRAVADASVTLALTMPGMYMADNRYLLKHKGEGRYEGEGVIVRCPSGRKIWQAEVTITRPGHKSEDAVSARYIFEVKR